LTLHHVKSDKLICSRDRAIPFPRLFAKLSGDTPVNALVLTTVVQMLLGLINLGSSSAFTAFASVGVIGLAAAYAIPVAVSMAEGRKAVSTARFRLPTFVGWAMNIIMVLWIAFQMVLFSMPATLPVTAVSMNYASVVFVGFFVLSTIYYVIWARKGTLKS
jgi:amino acid transporter